MAIIKELPKEERPREKALKYGINTLSDIELISLLLGKGYKDTNIIEVSASLLSKYKGIVGLLNVSITELKKNKGIKDVGALKIALIGEFYKRVSQKLNTIDKVKVDDEYLYNKYKSMFYQSTQEHLVLIILNRNKRIIHETVLYKGSTETIAYNFNDILKEVVKNDGYFYYLIHNHPDGDCSPSLEDKKATLSLSIKSKNSKIPLVDHLIIGDRCYYSFRKNEKITFSC